MKKQKANQTARGTYKRCSICGWPLVKYSDLDEDVLGCVAGNCCMRPFPEIFYDYNRACIEYNNQFPESYKGIINIEKTEV